MRGLAKYILGLKITNNKILADLKNIAFQHSRFYFNSIRL